MFYRRKIVLGLLQLYKNRLDKISVQKLVFLVTLEQKNPVFEFVPFKYGCYSYSLSADIAAMARRGQVAEDKTHISKIDEIDYLRELKADDKAFLLRIKNVYGHFNSDDLMRHIYLTHPLYAINSTKAPELLTEQEYGRVESSRPMGHGTTLFTIGYEGISFENYLMRLVQNDVKVLVDVRNNPISMKFGFSKSQLKRSCENLGILYVHVPEVGIKSAKRQTLNSQADYDKLFAAYRCDDLPQTGKFQDNILELLKQHKRIALTCFEANICQCHRKPLAEAIAKRSGFEYELKHI